MKWFGNREKIDTRPGHSFRLLQWEKSVDDVSWLLSPSEKVKVSGAGKHWHYHPALELVFFESGEGTRFVGDSIESIQKGDLILLGENLPHFWQPVGPSRGLCLQWFFPVGHPFWAFPETEALPPFFKMASRGILFSGRTARHLIAGLQKMAQVGKMERLGILFSLLANVALAEPKDLHVLSTRFFSPPKESRYQDAMRRAIDYLLENFREAIKLSDLLKVTSLTKPTFSRQFKEHTGKSFNEFIQQVRLEAARRELLETERPIIDIAFGCGFTQISFFNRVFRRAYQCSPGDLRNT